MKFFYYTNLLFMFTFFAIFTNAKRIILHDFITKTRDESFKKIGNIVQQCFKKSVAPTIAFGNWSSDRDHSIISKSLLSSEQISAIEMGQMDIPQQYQRLSIYHSDEIMFTRKSYFAQNVVLSISSNSSLAFALQQLKSSVWWNSEALFVLISENIENSCRFASVFLNTVWSFDVMSVIYFCKNASDKLLSVYTFHPFSHSASSFWKIVPVNDANSLKYKVLLKHVFEESDVTEDDPAVLCEELFFDKTTNLNGFRIRAAVQVFTKLTRLSESAVGFERFKGFFNEIYGTVAKRMNFTANVKLSAGLSRLDKNEKPAGTLKDLLDRSLDSEVVGVLMTKHWRGNSRSIMSSGIQFLSLKRSKSFESRFISIFTIQVLMFYAFICTAGVITLKYTINQPPSSLALEFLRILTNQSTSQQPSNVSSRLAFLFLIIIVNNASVHLHSQLSAATTVEESVLIDDAEDLIESSLPVYGPATYGRLLIHEELVRRYRAKSFDECVDSLFNGGDVVCAIGSVSMKYYARESNTVHISRGRYFSTGVVYTFREDWPLLRKFDDVLLGIVEGGFLGFFAEAEESVNRRSVKDVEVETELDQLRIGIYVLGSGLALSIVAFCFEILRHFIIIYRSKLR